LPAPSPVIDKVHTNEDRTSRPALRERAGVISSDGRFDAWVRRAESDLHMLTTWQEPITPWPWTGKTGRCRVRASNAGHCLFAGVAAPDRAPAGRGTLSNGVEMSTLTDSKVGPNVGAQRWAQRRAGAEAGDRGGWRNPSFGARVFLVGAVLAVPGVLAGLMVNLLLHFTSDPAVAAAAGSVVFAVVGGRMEAAG